MKTVLLLFTASRFSVPLVQYMASEGKRYGWKTCVGSMFDAPLATEENVFNEVQFIHIADYNECDHAIRKADVVAGLLPDNMLLQVADLCITNRKSFITPAKLSRQIVARKAGIEKNGILFLMECGFSPGLDHVTACKAIDNIHHKGGAITSFRSFQGSVLAESDIDNPLAFKLTESPAGVMAIGRQNNRYLYKGKIYHVPYHQLFDRVQPIPIKGLHNVVVIPEGDALYLRKIYQLKEASTVTRGRILRKNFADMWRMLIRLGLTDTQSKVEMFKDSSYYNYLQSLLPYDENDDHLEARLKRYINSSEEDILKLRWLGYFDQEWLQLKDPTPAQILQHLLQRKCGLKESDKDCVLMEHQLEYTLKDAHHSMKATLVAQGDNRSSLALDKAIGFVTGAALKAFLLDDIKVRGLHLPIMPEIYDPLLNELADLGVSFFVEEKRNFSQDEQAQNYSPAEVVPSRVVNRNDIRPLL